MHMPARERIRSTRALILRRRDIHDADRVLTALTPGEGKLELIAKGVRKTSSRKAGHLEPFVHVALTLAQGKRKLFSQQGEMLFTHTGVSGPLVLSASAYVQDDGGDYVLTIDLKPALAEKTLDRRVLRVPVPRAVFRTAIALGLFRGALSESRYMLFGVDHFVSIEKASAAGFTPCTGLASGLASTVTWLRSEGLVP